MNSSRSFLLLLVGLGCWLLPAEAIHQSIPLSLVDPLLQDSRAGQPMLYQTVNIPAALLTTSNGRTFGGDIRIGDLDNDGEIEFLVFRSEDDGHDGGGMKPVFLAAFEADGTILWQKGSGGLQPSRPGPVAIHDLDGDGQTEVVCFFKNKSISAPETSLNNVVLQRRSGATGNVEYSAAPAAFRACSGSGANWVHQRIMIANFRDLPTPRDFVVKLGAKIMAFDQSFNILWTYTIRSEWLSYQNCPAYIPCVGDLNGLGRDEVNDGYFVLNWDGTPLWERKLGQNMDSVAIAEWDNGNVRAICSGYGHVMSRNGTVILNLGSDKVPHGQEVRVARFTEDDPTPQMVIRYDGHTTAVKLVDNAGTIRNQFNLNASPNNTGMEVIYWNGPHAAALLYNGGLLWRPLEGEKLTLPGLPAPVGPSRMGWYHCIPANVCGDVREEAVLYNPWDNKIYIYSPWPLRESAWQGYQPGPRQYNARLMD